MFVWRGSLWPIKLCQVCEIRDGLETKENKRIYHFAGYILHFKKEASEWEELRLAESNSFMHENLRCGTRYQYYLVGFNSAGKGDPSQVVSARTDGTCKLA